MNNKSIHVGFLGDTKIFMGISENDECQSSIKFEIHHEMDNIEFDINYYDAEILYMRLGKLMEIAKANGEMYEDKPS